MKDKLKKYFKETLIFIVVMILFSNGLSLYKSMSLNKDQFSLTNINLINKEVYKRDEQKPLLVHLWATWCPTCKIEAQNIQTLSEHYNVLTIAVKSGSDDDINRWLLENNYTFNVLNDSSGFVASHFNLSVFPTTFIYDRNNQLVFTEVGYTSTWGLFLRMWWASL